MLGMSRELQSWQVFMQAQSSASQKCMWHACTERSSTLSASHTIMLVPRKRAQYSIIPPLRFLHLAIDNMESHMLALICAAKISVPCSLYTEKEKKKYHESA